jgi:hypothetical protein
MKKIIILLSILFITSIVYAQDTTRRSYYGGSFTPQDTLRMLVVFVGFGEDFDNAHSVVGWNGVYPDFAEGDKTYYNDVAQFDNPISPNDSHNVSRWYYEMSKQSPRPFKLLVDYVKVNLT